MEEALNEINDNPAPGPDGVPLSCYRHGGREIIDFIRRFMTTSMEESEVSLMHRLSLIAPIYMRVPKELLVNYRQVALTCHLIKLMERVVKKYMVSFLELLGLLDNSRHGCRAGRSTLSQFLWQYDKILEVLAQD